LVRSDEDLTGRLGTTTNAADRAQNYGDRVDRRWLADDSPTPVYVGVALIGIGLALVAYTWLRVADLSSVALQLPWVASGGFTGVGLVVVGALVVNIGAKRRESAERRKQIAALADLVATLSERS
jgi:hypothetical protein